MQINNTSFDKFLETKDQLAFVLDNDANEKALDAILGGTIARFRASDEFADHKGWMKIAYPSGMSCKSLFLAKPADDVRELGAKLAAITKGAVTVWGQDAEFAYGFALRNYSFSGYLTKPKEIADLTIAHDGAFDEAAHHAYQAIVEGTHFTRDLVHEPSNTLSTQEFASRIQGLEKIGVKVQILDEDELTKIGMRSLLAVGQGSEMRSKVAIMHWNGAKGDPLLLVGKGVVFDTGGISIKPSAGMEEMTMDMGGAATVVGTMHSVAKRKTKAHIIGIVGIVENMPDGKAQRPGDIVKSLKGDTIEVLNTDAEGRMVLADIIWYGQEQFKPKAVIDLATLTGAIIVALGHENAGVFGNDDAFTSNFITAAKAEGEGAWHMPLDKAYDKLIDRTLADIGNTGGRTAGASTAAHFIGRFVKDGTPWIHLDIAGVALRKGDDPYAPHGASGWGVRSLTRLIDDHFVS